MSIEYKDDFNPDPIRKMLGLDGSKCFLPKVEMGRLATMLSRHGKLSMEDFIKLNARGAKVIKENGPSCWDDCFADDRPSDR